MANILSQGAVFLEAQRIKHLSEPVTYRRGNNSVQVSATRGKTNFTVDDEAGFSVGSHVVDFIIARSEMHLDADVIIPRLGDTIEVADGMVFEVVYLASDGCWRFSDGIGLSMRIHTKRKQ